MSSEFKVAKLSDGAKIPTRAYPGDAGLDLYSTEELDLYPGERALVGTGIAVHIPHGYVGLIHPRSGLAGKHGITVLNTPGTIDAGYHGEIKVILYNSSDRPYDVNIGDRIAQLVVQEVVLADFEEVDGLDETDRGENGFGSSGK